ncbi:SPOR domain-containing protein [Marinilabilia sp.]|uniref:SPOR domain-containing protein n=1 Tax=Marinilabilia sp. TaxID=2021252 RepID=UPI0025C463DE|nr:SPOR domain-containing protein [Marinilabilia sp.]
MKKIFLLATALLVIGVACKDKKEPPRKEPVNKVAPAPKPDTIAQKVEEPKPEPKPVPQEPDKYFLIAGSFSNQNNAESFKKELTGQGFKSEVIIRNWGENSDFYKVSYMGFSNRKEAINKMQQERTQPGKEDVWVLVKK